MITIHQPNFLPYPGFFNKVKHSDIFVIYDTAQYVKGRWDNRNRLRNKSNQIYLTIPIEDKSSFKFMFLDVNLPKSEIWKNKHLKSIHFNYSRAPFYGDYIDDIEKLYCVNTQSLSEFNIGFIKYFASMLDIKTKIILASDLDIASSKKSSDALIDIAKSLGSKTYLSGPSGRDYLDFTKFEKEGIDVKIQDYKMKPYYQVHGEFIPNLSFLDMLLNVGPDSRYLI
tara:strand:+ start:187 stop:864 length:678 start_codon:yes stop_codon:yes gene_type:complete